MNIKQLAQQIASMTSEERQELSKEMNVLAEKPKRVFAPWRPEKVETYYHIIECGVGTAEWDSGRFAIDLWRLADNNVFQTHELARRAAEKKQARNTLLLEIREYMDEIGCEEPVWGSEGNMPAILRFNYGSQIWEFIDWQDKRYLSCIPHFGANQKQCDMILDKFGDRLDILLEDK